MYRKCFWWPVFVLLQILQTGNTGDDTVLHIESLDKESLQDNRARVNSAPDIGKFDWKHLFVLKIIITVILLLSIIIILTKHIFVTIGAPDSFKMTQMRIYDSFNSSIR